MMFQTISFSFDCIPVAGVDRKSLDISISECHLDVGLGVVDFQNVTGVVAIEAAERAERAKTNATGSVGKAELMETGIPANIQGHTRPLRIFLIVREIVAPGLEG